MTEMAELNNSPKIKVVTLLIVAVRAVKEDL